MMGTLVWRGGRPKEGGGENEIGLSRTQRSQAGCVRKKRPLISYKGTKAEDEDHDVIGG